MGWAKYLEDIQKIRENALSLAQGDISARLIDLDPDSARKEFNRVRNEIEKWAIDLADSFMALMNEATDPEVNRILELEKAAETIAALKLEAAEKISALHANIFMLTENNKKLQATLNAREIALAARLSEIKELKDAAHSVNTKLREQQELIVQIKGKLTAYEREANAKADFEKEMKSSSVKRLR